MNEALPEPQPPKSDEQERHEVEGAMGPAVDSVFSQYTDQASDSAFRNLTLYGEIDYKGNVPEVRIAETKDESGGRAISLIYDGGMWPGSGFKYTEAPGEKPRLSAGREKDGVFVEDPKDSIGQRDSDIAYWGKVWLDNLETMKPEPPKVERVRKLGRVAMMLGLKRKSP